MLPPRRTLSPVTGNSRSAARTTPASASKNSPVVDAFSSFPQAEAERTGRFPVPISADALGLLG
jgi:hypothetical protein